MNLQIDPKNVPKSFDRIAKSLLNEYVIAVNNVDFQITEIEFYYFHEEHHRDNYTHEHRREGGEWRFHNQGIDITLPLTDLQDGGILIRGLKKGEEYNNGPRNIIGVLFELFKSVEDETTFQIRKSSKQTKQIIKTFRHLPNKNKDENYHDKYYRYLVDLDDLKIPKSIKEKIIFKSEIVA